MESQIVAVSAIVLVLVIVLLIARRLLRFAVRLMFAGVLVLALLAAAAFGWWRGWFEAAAPRKPQRPAATRRATS